MKLTVTLEIEAELELDDSVDWKARVGAESTWDEMIGNLAYNVCVDNRICPQLDGFADLPEDAAIDRGSDIAGITVTEYP